MNTQKQKVLPVLQLELEAVRPDVAGNGQQEEEFRLSMKLLPLRLRLHQSMITFLQGFFASPVPADSPRQKASGMPPFFYKAWHDTQ